MKHFHEFKVQLFATTPDAQKWTATISPQLESIGVITSYGASAAEALLNLSLSVRAKELSIKKDALIPGHSDGIAKYQPNAAEDSATALPAQQHTVKIAAANDRQVGGDHYRGVNVIQHWDFAASNKLDYFQGQITKYVSRWKKKNGKQDLEKALHFLEKYMEVFEQYV